MGTDKALLRVAGTPMARRAADVLVASGADPIVAVGGDGGALTSLGLTFVADRWPGAGPLGGIITALDATAADVIVVVACDLVNPSATTIGALTDALSGDETIDAVVPLLAGRAQFDQLALRRRRAQRLLEDAFDDGVRSIHGALERLTVCRLEGIDPVTLRDADTRADLPLR